MYIESESITSLQHQLSLAKHTTGKPCVAPPHQQSSHSVNIQTMHHQDICSPPDLHLKSTPKKSNYKKFNYNMIVSNEVQVLESYFSPSAKVFPLNPRSTEMLSSGSLTTLQNPKIKGSKLKYLNNSQLKP